MASRVFENQGAAIIEGDFRGTPGRPLSDAVRVGIAQPKACPSFLRTPELRPSPAAPRARPLVPKPSRANVGRSSTKAWQCLLFGKFLLQAHQRPELLLLLRPERELLVHDARNDVVKHGLPGGSGRQMCGELGFLLNRSTCGALFPRTLLGSTSD